MSIPSFIDYLSLERNYSPHTVKAYERDLGSFLAFCNTEQNLEDIEQMDYTVIRNWIIHLVDSGVTNRSVNRKMAALKAYYKFLQKLGRITTNPLAKHRSLKTAKRVEVPFSEQEMIHVLEEMSFNEDFEGYRDKVMIELFYTSGIRRAELINLRLSDLDLIRNTMRVLGKRNKERILPLLPSTKQLLQQYLEERNALKTLTDEAYVFLCKSGKKIYETLVYRVINAYLERVSTKVKRSPHILRHTFATHLINKGADLNSVKELLGHSSLASTQVYTHNSIAELKRVHLAAHPILPEI